MRRALLLTYLLMASCLFSCGKGSNPLEATGFKRADLLGQWSAATGGGTMKWTKVVQDSIQDYNILFDSLNWDLSVDSNSYSFDVKATKPSASDIAGPVPAAWVEIRNNGEWLVSQSDSAYIRFSRIQGVRFSKFDTVRYISSLDRVVPFTQSFFVDASPYWDCKATVTGDELHLTEIDTSLGIPVDSVTFHRK